MIEWVVGINEGKITKRVIETIKNRRVNPIKMINNINQKGKKRLLMATEYGKWMTPKKINGNGEKDKGKKMRSERDTE